MTKPTESPKSSVATLRDVAARAGVTGMTASRVISGNGYASKATREAVMRAARELDYRPNMSAKAMRQQRSHSVGVLVQNNPQKRFTHPLAWEFVLGINEGLEQSGYMTSLIRIDDIAEDGDFAAKAFEGHLLDGLIAVNAFPPHLEERIEALAPHCVWLDANVWHPTHCIQRDEAWAGDLAVRELAKLGYREIVMVCAQLDGPHPHYSQTERLRGAQEAARELGVRVREWLNPQAVPDDTYHGLIPQLRPEEAVLMMDDYAMQAILLPWRARACGPVWISPSPAATTIFKTRRFGAIPSAASLSTASIWASGPLA